MPKLKVYRTPIGFHDAYVAAPSQKAALEAWGSEKNLFSHGAAEIVVDPALTAEPLASPGKVIKRLRGTVDEQMAALPAATPRMPRERAAPQGEQLSEPQAAKPPPPPSRKAVEQADTALKAFADRSRTELDGLARREAALAAERKSLSAAHGREEARLQTDLAAATNAYDRAVRKWKQGA